MRRILLLLAAALLAAAPAAAQRDRAGRIPPRPPLGAADTNSAIAYFVHGQTQLANNPRVAANAFYWANRLNPGWADALYGQYVATLMSDTRRLVDYMEYNRRVRRSPEMRANDSLRERASVLDPFLYRKFDKQLTTLYWQSWAEQEVRRENPTGVDPAAISHWVSTWLINAGPATNAWVAYSEQRFPDAARLYAQAVNAARPQHRWGLRRDRAEVLYLMGRYAEAEAEMKTAITEWRKDEEDDEDLVYLYESKAFLEHAVGMLHERQGQADAAREAYGRALQEDLAYYPAHVRLSHLALAAGDTATAVSEMDLAVQVRPEDAAMRQAYGMLLLQARRYPEAEAQFKAAVEHEPYYAQPYLMLARLYDASGMTTSALDHYEAFVARAQDTEARAA